MREKIHETLNIEHRVDRICKCANGDLRDSVEQEMKSLVDDILSDNVIRTFACIYQEMNAIRARDGKPQGVTAEYWDRLLEELNDFLSENTGHGGWLHPALYRKLDTPSKELTDRIVEKGLGYCNETENFTDADLEKDYIADISDRIGELEKTIHRLQNDVDNIKQSNKVLF